jgi:CBS domain-containing protein
VLVRDLMQREVVTLRADDHLDLADDVMRLGRVRHMPVVAGERVIGVLSQRDLFRAAVSSLLEFDRAAEQDWLARVPVATVMSTPAVTVPSSCPMRRAVEIMTERRIGCLPVVDEGRLAGLLSETDCLRHLAHLLAIAEVKDDLPELPD